MRTNENTKITLIIDSIDDIKYIYTIPSNAIINIFTDRVPVDSSPYWEDGSIIGLTIEVDSTDEIQFKRVELTEVN